MKRVVVGTWFVRLRTLRELCFKEIVYEFNGVFTFKEIHNSGI